MSEVQDYSTRIKAIQAHNQPILNNFEAWLTQSGLSPKKVKNQVQDIAFFAEYLVYEDKPFKRLDEADEGDVYGFLSFWFPRKAMWSSPNSTKEYFTSFRKFFKWLGQTGQISEQVVGDVLNTLKEDRDTFLQAANGDLDFFKDFE